MPLKTEFKILPNNLNFFPTMNFILLYFESQTIAFETSKFGEFTKKIMLKKFEIRDAIHGFVHHDEAEKQLINSDPVQRLRNIHQLAMTYQIYPGATHRRFEHSLGVMELAGRIHNVLEDSYKKQDASDKVFSKSYERESANSFSLVRAAALLHDVGHLPFSHAAEGMLPENKNHEVLTAQIIRKSLQSRLEELELHSNNIIMTACEEKHHGEIFSAFDEAAPKFTPWRRVQNEIITGDIFGADRMDYLLRDAHHTGVVAGKFDLDRLIQGLRIVVNPVSEVVEIGLEHGAIHAAEELLMARYFMYSQVYFHKTRLAYNIHLKDFLRDFIEIEIRESGRIDSAEDLINFDENDVLLWIREALADKNNSLNKSARCLLKREHYRVAYTFTHVTLKKLFFFEYMVGFANSKFGEENVRSHKMNSGSNIKDFLVVRDNEKHENAKNIVELSQVIANMPSLTAAYIFVEPEIADSARNSLAQKARELLSMPDSDYEDWIIQEGVGVNA